MNSTFSRLTSVEGGEPLKIRRKMDTFKKNKLETKETSNMYVIKFGSNCCYGSKMSAGKIEIGMKCCVRILRGNSYCETEVQSLMTIENTGVYFQPYCTLRLIDGANCTKKNRAHNGKNDVVRVMFSSDETSGVEFKLGFLAGVASMSTVYFLEPSVEPISTGGTVKGCGFRGEVVGTVVIIRC